CRSKARVERGGDPGVPIADQKPEPADMVVEGHEQVAGLLGHPLPHHSPIGCAVTPSTWTRREATSSTNSTYRRLRNTVSTVKQVHRQHTLGLGPEELPPGDRRPLRCRVDTGALQDGPDGAGPELVPEPPQPARAPPVPPGGILPGQPQHQRAELRRPRAAGHTGASRSNGAAPGRDASAAVSPAARTSPAKPDGGAAAHTAPA